jgi:hypothetical protein
LEFENADLRAKLQTAMRENDSRKRQAIGSVEYAVEKHPKMEEKDGVDGLCYIYVFKSSDTEDLYLGRGNMQSKPSREWIAINPTNGKDKTAVSSFSRGNY